MKLTSALLCVVLCVACSGTGPTSPSSTSVVGDGNGRAVLFTNPPLPPNSEFPGTGNNRGAGAGNTCPSDLPVVNRNGNKLTTTKVGGDLRGYIFQVYKMDNRIATFVLQTPMTDVRDVHQGREAAFNLALIEPGKQHYAIGWPVFVGCGKGSESKAFYFSV